MSRNLADLVAEASSLGLQVKQSGKRESKGDYEVALRDHYWNRDHAGEELPEQILPMLARNSKDLPQAEVDEMFRDGSKWVAQEKINGCRCMIKIRNPSKGRINHATSRRLSDETYRLNELHDKLPHYRDMNMGDEWEDTVIDGEILSPVPVVDTTVVDGKGVKTLDILQATAAMLNCDPEKSRILQNLHGKLVLHAFDCLRFKGKDLRNLPYVVLGKDDQVVGGRYFYLQQAVVRVQEVLGALPCQHCEGVRRVVPDKKPAVDVAPVASKEFNHLF